MLQPLSWTLQDRRDNYLLKGELVVKLGSDFHQTLPVIPKRTMCDKIHFCSESFISLEACVRTTTTDQPEISLVGWQKKVNLCRWSDQLPPQLLQCSSQLRCWKSVRSQISASDSRIKNGLLNAPFLHHRITAWKRSVCSFNNNYPRKAKPRSQWIWLWIIRIFSFPLKSLPPLSHHISWWCSKLVLQSLTWGACMQQACAMTRGGV
jgi:hypothetical protein